MTKEENLENIIFPFTKEVFSKEVTEMVWMEDILYIEAMSELIKKYEMDVEVIPKLLTNELKEEIEIEAEKLNLVKTKKSRLF